MTLLVMFLLAAPALAQSADCPSVGVGPPMDIAVSIALPKQAKTPARAPATGWLSPQRIPSLGTDCLAPPPPATDVLHGPPAPRGLLHGDGAADVLHHGPATTPP
jgi:hypothetical protein